MTKDEILPACEAITKETGLPAFDVLEFGAEDLIRTAKIIFKMITLESFVVLKKLSVKNIKIEPKKVKADYCIEKSSGETDSVELIYSYEKPYFSKKNANDVNLASMMLAQVALNYGLFFETIEFDGLFDKVINDLLST